MGGRGESATAILPDGPEGRGEESLGGSPLLSLLLFCSPAIEYGKSVSKRE